MTDVHLVGSINLTDERTVFQTVAEQVGPAASRIPDGETGRHFVIWMLPRLTTNPAVVVSEGGAMGGLLPRLSVRPGSEQPLTFGDLGFAGAAKNSYRTFSQLKQSGIISDTTRFQVSIPTPLTLAVALCEPDAQAPFINALTAAISDEITDIAGALPHEELAIQFDMPGEIGCLEGVFPAALGTDRAVMAAAAARVASAVPPGVDLGIHLCYGAPPPAAGERGKHWLEPTDTTVMVELANSVVAATDRLIQWVHIPVPVQRHDQAYFSPLADLHLGPARLYLGLIHDADGKAGSLRRAAAAQRVVRDFGVATECGLLAVGMADVPPLLALHREVAVALA